MPVKEWNIRGLRKEDLEQVGGWMNILSGKVDANNQQAVNVLTVEWLANQISNLGQFYLVLQGDEPILHITLINLSQENAFSGERSRTAIIFVLMNPAYDENELFWLKAWRTALEHFYIAVGLTRLRIRIAQGDRVQIGALKRLGFVASSFPGEYEGDLKSWVQL